MCHISTPKHSRSNELSQGETSSSPQRGTSIGTDRPVGADCLNRDALRRHVLLRSANISQQRTDQVAGESPLTTATGARRTIVIDLDVLCCDVKVYGHAKRFVHRVWPRPHARLFLQTVSPHFRLAVWSRASAAHIDAALLALDPRKEFLPRRAPAPGTSSAAAAEETLLPVAQLDLGGAMGRNHRHARTQNHSHAESGMEDLLVWDGDEEDADVSYEEEEGFCTLDQEDDEDGDESEGKGRQLAASASEGGHADVEAGSRNTGVWTILDDGELVDPTDVVVLAADRATFGALQGSVIEVAPFEFNTSSAGTSGATGGPDDDVLLRLAAVLVRFMATAQATAPLPTPLPSQHQPWKPHGTASAAGAPAVASRTSVESDLQQLGLWGIRFGDTGSQTTATAAAAPRSVGQPAAAVTQLHGV